MYNFMNEALHLYFLVHPCSASVRLYQCVAYRLFVVNTLNISYLPALHDLPRSVAVMVVAIREKNLESTHKNDIGMKNA